MSNDGTNPDPGATNPVRVIVVGAGPAGCVVSRRLSDAGHEVMLIEAGPGSPPPDPITSPDWFEALGQPDWLWPNLLVSRTDGQPEAAYLRGRGLGGCSAVNAMIALTGPGVDLSLFANSQAQLRVSEDIPSQVVLLGPLAGALGQSTSVSRTSLLLKEGRRASAYDIYLAGREDQLEILTDTAVVRLVITSGRRVTGVQLETGEILSADRVVLCAGAIHTPTLLLRSEVLNPYIGVGLQDHPAIPFTLKLKQPGPVGTPAATGLATWSSGLTGRKDDLQVLVLEHLGETGLGQVMVALMDVESRGSVKVDSNGEPVVRFNMLSERADRVRLRHGVRRLVQLLVDGVFEDLVSDIYTDAEGAGLGSVPVSRTSLFDLSTDDDALDDWMHQHLGDYVHAACSCQLDTAVGNGGTVRGWQGISVIDASVMPKLPRANTQVPTLMLAESLATQLLVLLAT